MEHKHHIEVVTHMYTISDELKIYELSKFWKEAEYNFAFWDKVNIDWDEEYVQSERKGLYRAALEELRLTSAMVDAFCLEPQGDNPLADALSDREERSFAAEINTMLLERAARVSAACLAAIVEKRALPAGSRVCVCADGTMLREEFGDCRFVPMLKEIGKD